MILRVLTDTSGQPQCAADIPGISLRTLGRKLKPRIKGKGREVSWSRATGLMAPKKLQVPANPA